jgi:hypothetical protein
MQDVFTYPVTQSAFWLDNYYVFTWASAMAMLAGAWAVLFRYGNFKYGIDLGCLVKTFVIMLVTMLCLGFPMYYNTKFAAQHGHEGDKIILTDDALRYTPRTGKEKTFKYSEVFTIYREPFTFNPPPAHFVVALKDSVRLDSVVIKEDLPQFDALIKKLDVVTNGKVKKSL